MVLVNVQEPYFQDTMKHQAFIISQINDIYSIIREDYAMRDINWFLRIDMFISG